MSPEKPPDEKEGFSLGLEVRHLSPEEGEELLAGMRENIAGLESWLAERREALAGLEADPNTPPQELESLRKEIWDLAEDIDQQKEFVKESTQE